MMTRFLLPLAILLLAAGCVQIPILYSPPPVHAPLFDSAGQSDISIHAGFHSFDLRGAYSPVNHLELLALGSYFGNRSDSTAEHAFHKYGEFGIGGYTGSSSVHFEAVIGYGFGTAAGYGRNGSPFYDNQPSAWMVTGDFRRYFAQLTIGSNNIHIPLAPWSSLALVMRVADVEFISIDGLSETSHASAWLLEPTIIERAGDPSVQFEMQLGFATFLNDAAFNTFSPSVSIGLRVLPTLLF